MSNDQDGRHAHIWLKPLEIFLSGTKRPMTLKLGLRHWLLEYYQVCSNDDLGLTFIYFSARSNLVPFIFIRENVSCKFPRNY